LTIGEWAKIKGLDLVGTGDLTHPAWLQRLRETLVRGKSGLYHLIGDENGPQFVPTGEVSAIFKQDGRTRKIHLVVVAPDLEAAERFSQNLGKLGNITSDGRPILGLKARDILEIALLSDSEMEVIPAHVWTPWFSLFGSKSGFDSVEECFGDLAGHIHALETGLSSDPEMNRLVSALDRYTLVSSSDAHSTEKLGREATVLEGELSYEALKKAFRGETNLVGTVEFFPEEGKYHLDGHSTCGPALTPAETKAAGGLCPFCGKPLTVGVLSRVMELADRESAPTDRLPDWHLLPLVEVLAQTLDVGPTSKEVTLAYNKLIGEFGSEYKLLLDTPLAEIGELAGPVLARAVERMRLGQVEANAGYDGKFGQIKVISRQERLELSGQGLLFGAPATPRRGRRKVTVQVEAQGPDTANRTVVKRRAASGGILSDLSTEQHQAVSFAGPALALTAGPGAGKTMVLVRRAAFMIRNGLVSPENILLTTYTRKAAETLANRLCGLLGPDAEKVAVSTLHALALSLASNHRPGFSLAEDGVLTQLATEAGAICGLTARRFQNLAALNKNHLRFGGVGSPGVVKVVTDAEMTLALMDQIIRFKEQKSPESRPAERPADQGPMSLSEAERSALERYQGRLEEMNLWDYDDLILEATRAVEEPGKSKFSFVMADEFQDFSLAQYRFLQAVSKNAAITVIGDPDQSIYGFRGAYGAIFSQLAIDRQDLVKMDLTLNFRSNPIICQASETLRTEVGSKRTPARKIAPQKIARVTLDGPASEADWVVKKIVSHLGVTNLGQFGTSTTDKDRLPDLTIDDIAVIFRLRQVGQEVAQALEKVGLPYQMAGEEEETATDGLDFKADKISLLTMHAAKGLEFRLVFVIGLEEGLCPYEPGGQVDHGEEKRLFYVAITRAKDTLYLTRSSSRFLFGQKLSGNPSPYWSQIPAPLCYDFTFGPRKAKEYQPKVRGRQWPRLF
jgi:DNA helicase-2/ATP-dependent DNA helicase PcrA